MKTTRRDILKHGLLAGTFGYVAIMLYYGAVNLIAGRSPFHTVATIGAALFQPEDAVGAVIAYNGVHLIAFLLLGLTAAALVQAAERNPPLWHAVLFTLIALFLFSSCLVAGIAGSLAHVSAGVVLAGNLFAGLALGGYIASRHPGLEQRIELLSDAEYAELAA